MPRLLAINGCYRKNSIIDQAVELAMQASSEAGATAEVAFLRDLPVRHCLDCRLCSGPADAVPRECVIRNHMQALLGQIEAADGFILASPANLYTTTHVYKRFAQRLMEYRHRHGEHGTPPNTHRPALLISTSATPGLIGRLYYSTHRQLALTARTLGACPAGSVFVEMHSHTSGTTLPDRSRRRLRELATRLLHR